MRRQSDLALACGQRWVSSARVSRAVPVFAACVWLWACAVWSSWFAGVLCGLRSGRVRVACRISAMICVGQRLVRVGVTLVCRVFSLVHHVWCVVVVSFCTQCDGPCGCLSFVCSVLLRLWRDAVMEMGRPSLILSSRAGSVLGFLCTFGGVALPCPCPCSRRVFGSAPVRCHSIGTLPCFVGCVPAAFVSYLVICACSAVFVLALALLSRVLSRVVFVFVYVHVPRILNPGPCSVWGFANVGWCT